jgi:hypothetical protein
MEVQELSVEAAQPLPADQFRVGEVWQSPRGVRYRVSRVKWFFAGNGCRAKRATLKAVESSRTACRNYGDIDGWVRLSAAGEGEA